MRPEEINNRVIVDVKTVLGRHRLDPTAIEVALAVWAYRRADWCFTDPTHEPIQSQIAECVDVEYPELSIREAADMASTALSAYLVLESILDHIDDTDVLDCSMRKLGARTVVLELITRDRYVNYPTHPTCDTPYQTPHQPLLQRVIGMQQNRLPDRPTTGRGVPSYRVLTPRTPHSLHRCFI